MWWRQSGGGGVHQHAEGLGVELYLPLRVFSLIRRELRAATGAERANLAAPEGRGPRGPGPERTQPPPPTS